MFFERFDFTDTIAGLNTPEVSFLPLEPTSTLFFPPGTDILALIVCSLYIEYSSVIFAEVI